MCRVLRVLIIFGEGWVNSEPKAGFRLCGITYRLVRRLQTLLDQSLAVVVLTFHQRETCEAGRLIIALAVTL